MESRIIPIRNKGCQYSDRISTEDEGLLILAFYVRHYPHSTEETWREHIRIGRISRNGKPASPDEILIRGDFLVYSRPAWEEPDAPVDFGVLYEDDDILVLDKPSGLPVLPGGGFLENTLLHLARKRFGPECSPLHRLGRGTSGAILFTRNEQAARFLTKAMVERQILKVYLAKASGLVSPDAFTVDVPIGPVPNGKGATVNAYSPRGRAAISHVRVIRHLTDENASILEVTIPTGRPHQIRIHLAYAGYPLVGDPLYGPGGLPWVIAADGESTARPGDCGYLLHSWKIRFPRPDGRGEREVIAPPPPALAPEP
ncbi:MAG: RluA family pseudouridine synthase [Candidatus Aminicenantes bacterium]|nr:RluA family pseudouridine synthase [Candidatus Aminicenantes bacterium]